MLSARGEETDRIVGLEVGADDYVVKPFSARELVARVRAVLRRTQREPPAEEEPLEVGGLRLDPARHEASLDGEPLDLTRKEFEVLRLLMRNAGAVVSRDQLIDEVWDVNWFGPTKTLDVHVSGLRKKLGDDPGAPRYLHTVRGVGFRFARSGRARRRAAGMTPARPPAGRVRVCARARDRRARGAARAEPVAARRRRGQERGELGRAARRGQRRRPARTRTRAPGAAAHGRPSTWAAA